MIANVKGYVVAVIISLAVSGYGSLPQDKELLPETCQNEYFSFQENRLSDGMFIEISGLDDSGLVVRKTNEVTWLEVSMRNRSKKFVILLTDPMPISLFWTSIITDKDEYSITNDRSVHQHPPVPISCIYFLGNKAWENSRSFATAKVFKVEVPKLGGCIVDSFSGNESATATSHERLGSERFVSGEMVIRIDVSYILEGSSSVVTQTLLKSVGVVSE